MNVQPESRLDVARTLEAGGGRSRRKWMFRLIIAAVLTAALPLGYRWAGGTGKDAPHVRTEPATRGSLSVTVSATGTLKPTNQVEVGSELSGIVEIVEKDFNDRVKIGEVLARLDPDKLDAAVKRSRAALASTRAQVQRAQAGVAEARSDLARLEQVSRLSNTRAVSERDLESARASMARAEAEEAVALAAVDEAAAALQSNETDLAKTLIRAPINGIVLTRSVEPGQTVAASLQAPVLFTLAEDLTQMELHVDVDEADVGRVRGGQESVFRVDAFHGRTFEARITQVRYGAKTVDGVVTYETVLAVDNHDLSLRPGMTATAEITVEEIEDALMVPNAALRFTPPAIGQPEKGNGGGLVQALVPRPGRRGPQGNATRERNIRGARVWALQDGRFIEIPLVTGASDGSRTVVLEGDLSSGTNLAVDTVG